MRLELSKTQATYEAENYNFLSDTEPRWKISVAYKKNVYQLYLMAIFRRESFLSQLHPNCYLPFSISVQLGWIALTGR